MANTIKLEIITPSRLFYRGEVEMVIVPTLFGEEGFMANHSWATKLLDVGEMAIQEPGGGGFKIAAIAGGFIDVKDSIVVYADHAEWQEELDKKRAEADKQAVEEWLAQHREEDSMDVRRAEVMLKKAISRMRVAEGGRRAGH
ncbi:MAG: ATP synthase F1 subunit epsilon [Firmicutes bacterium]|nr:ATP synthase F1 subunit epsilon [Bacillota bacterium]